MGKALRLGLISFIVSAFGGGVLLLTAYFLGANIPGLPSPVAPAPAQSAEGNLWAAYEQGRGAARDQAADVQLVSASTQWQKADEQALLRPAGNWALVFHSPAAGSVLDVVVSGGAAQVINRSKVRAAPSAVPEGEWVTGPRDAMLVFLAYGGRTFLEGHPDAIVSLHLSQAENGNPAWNIVALNASDRSLFSVQVDATTEQVLAVEP